MFNLKDFFEKKMSRRRLIRAGMAIPGIALLSATGGCDSDTADNNDLDEFVEAGGLTLRMASREFADGESFELEASSCGWGWVQAGRNTAYCNFMWDGDNTVTKISGNGSSTSDTDACLCVFNNGTNVEVKNNLNASLTIRYALYYSEEGQGGGTTTTTTSTSPSAPVAK